MLLAQITNISFDFTLACNRNTPSGYVILQYVVLFVFICGKLNLPMCRDIDNGDFVVGIVDDKLWKIKHQ
jgi:hypothetical protein